jgi:hypothetical protein
MFRTDSFHARPQTSAHAGTSAAALSLPLLIRVEPVDIVVRAGEARRAGVTATMCDGSRRDVTFAVSWRSEDERIASVDAGGRIFGLEPGETVVHAVWQGKSAEMGVTVLAARSGRSVYSGS